MSLPRKICECFVIWAAGDATAQFVEKHKFFFDSSRVKSKEFTLIHMRDLFDSDRSLQAAFFGGFVFAPMANRWYNSLLKALPQHTSKVVAQRVLLDQLMWSPFILSVYFLYMAFSSTGFTVDAIHCGMYSLRELLPSTLALNWCYWVPLQLFNFYYVSPARWLLTVNIAAVPWTAYLASRKA